MPLHVVQIGPFPPPEGGVTRNIISIRDELRQRGHRCSIIATSKSIEPSADADVYHPRSPLSLFFRLAGLRPDLVHLHIGGNITGRLLGLALVCTILARRTVFTLHSGGYPLSDAGRKASPGSIRGFIFRRFSRMIAVSGALRELFLRYGVPPERISVVPPFALKYPEAVPEVPDDLNDFFDEHSPIFAAIGGLEKTYQPLFLVSAMDRLRESFPDCGLIIVGGGPMRQETEDAVTVAGQQENIYLTGSIDHTRSMELMRRSDAVVRSSLFDGDAISIREALFLGTPVVATDTEGRPDGVATFPIGDTAAMVRCLRDAIAAAPAKTRAPDDVSNITAVVNIYDEVCRSV